MNSLFYIIQKILKYFCALFDIEKRTQCSVREKILKNEESNRNGNNCVDDLVNLIIEDHDDPCELEDAIFRFKPKFFSGNFYTEMKLYDCYIMGINTLHRSGGSTLWKENEIYHLEFTLGVGMLHYYGMVKFMKLFPPIAINADISYIDINIELCFDKDGLQAYFHRFAVDDMRGINVTIRGLGPLNWIVNSIISAIMCVLAMSFKKKVEEELRTYATNYINSKVLLKGWENEE